MSRFKDFAQLDVRSFDDVNTILEDQGETFDVYRPASPQPDDGFTQEVGSQTRHSRLLAYVTQDKQSSSHRNNNDIKMSVSLYYAMTNEIDVRIGDVWQKEAVKYKVRSVNKAFKNQIQVKLERKE